MTEVINVFISSDQVLALNFTNPQFRDRYSYPTFRDNPSVSIIISRTDEELTDAFIYNTQECYTLGIRQFGA